MSSYYNYNAHQHPTSAHAQSASSSHHSGRGRRAPRLSQNSHKQQFRNSKREEEAVVVTNFRQRFEAGRSFDLDDDLEFCPNLLTELDMADASDRSSLSSVSSGSPESSPQSHQVAPDSGFSLNHNSAAYIPTYQNQQTTLKLHQPAATRIRNAIPIVNPTTGMSMSSPPQSVSPARMNQQLGRRW